MGQHQWLTSFVLLWLTGCSPMQEATTERWRLMHLQVKVLQRDDITLEN